MQTLLLTYLKEPNLPNFTTLRLAHLAQKDLNPYSGKLNPVGKLLSGGQYNEACALISKHLIPDYLMSAGTHLQLAFAQTELKKNDKAEFERFLASKLVLGIEMTGKGTEARPFLVTRTSDGSDFLIYRKQTPAVQSLVESSGRRLDRIETQSGELFWFDITEIFAIMQRAARRA